MVSLHVSCHYSFIVILLISELCLFSVLSDVLSFLIALRDHRIELVRASSLELTIRISDVSLSDEGLYTCSLFTMPVKTTKSVLTVLGEHVSVGSNHCHCSCYFLVNSLHSDSINTAHLQVKLLRKDMCQVLILSASAR